MSAGSAGNDDEGRSRRQAIRWIVFGAIGLGIAALGSISLIESSGPASDGAGDAGEPEPQASPAGGAAGSGPPTTVKVLYFQMPQIVSDHQEYIVLQSPATFSDLLRAVTNRHPALAGMTQSMMILIDGNVAKAGTPLKDGDEVDFIPAFPGG